MIVAAVIQRTAIAVIRTGFFASVPQLLAHTEALALQ